MDGNSNPTRTNKPSRLKDKALLCLETSTAAGSVALVNRKGVLARSCRADPAPHAKELFLTVKLLLDECHQRPADLRGVAVAAGPGSFTGLRVAVSAGKTLAWSAGVPLFAVGSLEALAFGPAAWKVPVCAIFNAGQEEFYAGVYSRSEPEGPIQEIVAPGAFALDRLCAELTGFKRVICLGEGFRALEKELTACLGQRLEQVPSRYDLPDAALVGELVFTGLERYRVEDIFRFEPFYVRSSRAQLRLKV